MQHDDSQSATKGDIIRFKDEILGKTEEWKNEIYGRNEEWRNELHERHEKWMNELHERHEKSMNQMRRENKQWKDEILVYLENMHKDLRDANHDEIEVLKEHDRNHEQRIEQLEKVTSAFR